MDWVPVRYRDLCKKMFIDECNLMSSLMTTNSDSADDSDNMSDEEFYSNILCDQNSNHDSPNEEINVQVLKYLNSKKKELQLLNNYPVVKKIFLKYNTILPSSAPVERLFSGAVQVLTSRRNRLGDKTFNKLLCCRSKQ